MSEPLSLTADGYADEHIEATPIHNNWLFVYWPKNKAGRLSKEMVKRLRAIERQLPDHAFRGWVCNSEKSHGEMHKLIQKFGARPYAENADLIFFKKEIVHVQ